MNNKNETNRNIKCSVDNCNYNKNHLCSASSIEVNAMGDGHADTSDGTACSTFVSKQNNF